MPEEYFVDCAYGVTDADYFQITAPAKGENAGGEELEFFVVGLDDGTIHAYDYTKNKSKSY